MKCWDVEKLHAEKHNFEIQGCQVGEMKNIEEKSDLHSLRSLGEWGKWKMLQWLTMRKCVWMWPGTMWQYGGVPCTKNYLPPSRNEEYYTTAAQCETLRSRTVCWFTYFAVSRSHNKTNNASTLAVSVFILLLWLKRPSGTFYYSRRFPTSSPWRAVLSAITHQDRLDLQEGPFS